jgi:hypothetical protein
VTELILGILSAQANLVIELVRSQSPAQQQVLWDRYIAATAPLQALLIKVEGLILPGAPAPAPAAAGTVTK